MIFPRSASPRPPNPDLPESTDTLERNHQARPLAGMRFLQFVDGIKTLRPPFFWSDPRILHTLEFRGTNLGMTSMHSRIPCATSENSSVDGHTVSACALDIHAIAGEGDLFFFLSPGSADLRRILPSIRDPGMTMSRILTAFSKDADSRRVPKTTFNNTAM
jgi:hypothetical protein